MSTMTKVKQSNLTLTDWWSFCLKGSTDILSMYGLLTTGHSKENLLNSPTFSSTISTPDSARKYLEDHFLLNQDPNHSSLSYTLLHLTFTATSITAPVADAIRSIAILFDSITMTPPPTPQQPPDTQISLLNSCIQDLCEMIETNRSSANVITWVINKTKDDLHNTAQHMAMTTEELIDAAKNTPTPTSTPPPDAVPTMHVFINLL